MPCPDVNNPVAHAVQNVPADEGAAALRQQEELDALLGTIATLEPLSPVAEDRLREASGLASALFTRHATSFCSCRLARWHRTIEIRLRDEAVRLLGPDQRVALGPYWEAL
jgi:hypothetical protein